MSRQDELAEYRRYEPVRHFTAALAKAVRSYNIYSRNNAALEKLLDDAFRYAQTAFEAVGDLDLAVRNDRLHIHNQPVLEDNDRELGIPFRLFREGVRRITFSEGLDKAELNKAIEVLSHQHDSGDLDDDLVSSLWRANLPHISYVTVDVYAVTGAADGPTEDDTQEDLKQDLDGLLAAIYQGGTTGADGVKVVNISSDDLVALATLGDDREHDTAHIGTPTARAIFNLDPAHLAALQEELANDSDSLLLDAMLDVLLGVLFRVRSAAESQLVIQELLKLYDTMLVERNFADALVLVRRMKSHSDDGDLKNVALGKQLLKLFSSEQRLGQLVVTLNDSMLTSLSQLQALLHELGADVVPSLISLLHAVQQPQHRRLLCDLMLEVAPPSPKLLRNAFAVGDWYVDRDLLYLAQRVGGPEADEIIFTGCHHPHARVRQQALGMLQSVTDPRADTQLIKALDEEDSTLRVTAVRTLVARRTSGVDKRLLSMIKSTHFEQRDAAEQRTFLIAFGTIAGPRAVPILTEMMQRGSSSAGGLWDRLRSTVEGINEAQEDLICSAAIALGAVGSPQALDVLRQGCRSRSKRLRETCERAIALAGSDAHDGKATDELNDEGGTHD